MKKILTVAITLILLTALSLCVFAENGLKIVKTDIMADKVVNYEGFGCILKDEVLAEDGETVISRSETALIDRNGNVRFPYKKTSHVYRCYDGIVSLTNSNAYTRFYLENGEVDKVGFYNLNGEELFPNSFWGATAFSGGYAFATKLEFDEENETAEIFAYLIDRKGNVVLDLKDGFKEGLNTSANGYGETFIAYEDAGDYSGGLLTCWRYDEPEDLANNAFSAFFMDKDGNVVLELPKSSITAFKTVTEDLICVVSQDGLYGFIDFEGNIVIPCEYDDLGTFFYGMAIAGKDGRFGYINKKGEVIIPFEYDDAYGAACGLFAVVKDGKCGLVDENNNVVVPFEYDDITGFDMNTAYAVKDGYVYIITGEQEISVKVDGTFLEFDQPPVLQNDRTLVPFRAIFEALGANVDWDDATQTAIAVKGDTTLKITIGDDKLYKNDGVIELDVPAQILNDRTLVPVRAISEAFGCEVNWVDETQLVVIFSE